MLVAVPLTHRRVLRRQMPRWFLEDVLPPLLGTILVAKIWRSLITLWNMPRI